eukprot:scaffold392275_cov14-Prasinocladus_malaysianus.AAC.1
MSTGLRGAGQYVVSCSIYSYGHTRARTAGLTLRPSKALKAFGTVPGKSIHEPDTDVRGNLSDMVRQQGAGR